MTSKLDKLLSIRTRMIGDFEHHAEEAEKFTTDSDKTLVSFRSSAFEKSFKEFMELTDELEKVTAYHELDNWETLVKKHRTIQDRYLTVKMKLNPLLETDNTALHTSFYDLTLNRSLVSEFGDRAESNTSTHHGIKLANLHLTPFSGSYESWPEFKDSFTSVMKKYKGDNVEKFAHLKNYLRGDALDLVRHLPLTNDSYDHAWTLLTQEWENRSAIIEAYLEKITTIPNIVNNVASTISTAISTTKGCLAAITNLEIMTESWDPLIVFMLKKKLDYELRSKWEEERKGSFEPPKLKEFLAFLKIRQRVAVNIPRKTIARPHIPENKQRVVHTHCVLESNIHQAEDLPSENNNETETDDITSDSHRNPEIATIDSEDETDAQFLYTRHNEVCGVCSNSHRVFTCPKLNANAHEALQIVKDKQLCTNCLYKHRLEDCASKFTCKICKQKHHSLLHDAFQSSAIHLVNIEQMFHVQSKPTRALLATAFVPIQTQSGRTTVVRALIDQGSTANLISEKAAQLLNCTRESIITRSMLGLGNVQTGTARFRTNFIIGSMYEPNFKLAINAYITPVITSVRPITSSLISKWSHLEGLELADPSLTNTQDIDLLIGSVTLAYLLEEGLRKGQETEPIAQKTSLGWITSGACDNIEQINYNTIDEWEYVHMITNDELSHQLKTFWVIEETPQIKEWSEDEKTCDELFTKTISRGSDGKFIMRIPFKIDPTTANFLGDSFEYAKRRFFQLERKFARIPNLKAEYTKGINEYLELGHAVKVPMSQLCHVIPHHAVFKETSTTTKLRTVYDASAKTTNGFSLNDRMYVGPTLLEDLWAVLLRWRCGKIAVTADIEKMYRQFWIHPNDAKYLQILWRTDSEAPLELLELRTVTFGTAAAPYMAIKGLHLIASAIQSNQPELAQSIIKCFYVDDYLEAFDTIEEAEQKRTKLTQAMAEYGLNLRKWQTNFDEQTEDIVDIKTNPLDTTCTALGMQWNTSTDAISYKVTLKKEPTKITKREVLSEIASMFDPLGLLAPIIMRAKAFMQQLWLGTFGWDDELPPLLKDEWKKIKASLQRCSNFRVPREIGYMKTNKHVSLHGFCDASEKMYAAACYLRTEDPDGLVNVHLLTAKTKVAPLKKISIPRLELCAAELLTTLMQRLTQALQMPNLELFAWTDSGIVLAWIATPSYKLKTFVGNRVSKIQEQIPSEKWRHVSTSSNPADYATRIGNELVALTKWWTGPSFLCCKPEEWPKIPDHMLPRKKIPELRTQFLLQQTEIAGEPNDLLLRYSSLFHLLKITAYCTRWLKKYRHLQTDKKVNTAEINNAKHIWIRQVQKACFEKEMQCLKNGKALPNTSQLLSLLPMLDDMGILRVKGRLSRSNLPTDVKHPIIMPTNHKFTELIINQAHWKTLHGGLQLTMRTIRDEFWIIRGKAVARNQLRKCVTCYRSRCQPAQQQMADLLAPQVQPNRPFAHTGVDFAGHFFVKTSIRRNAGYVKCYISLFICLTTKAIHLELARNLTTEAFIEALNNFIGRRGVPNHMYSDRGSNFIGASSQLPELWYQSESKESQTIQEECLKQGIKWHFNPARACHFGGLWEAGVKSVKTHLHRILKDARLTFSEFNSLLIQIEACLNSRPLCPLTDDAEDDEVITPGHFLIGQALTTAPFSEIQSYKMTINGRYQFLQKAYQSFWDQWSREYLTRLQHRPKWKAQHPNLRVGQIVVIKEDNIAPTKWLLGRITETFKGNDGLIRSAIVKTKSKRLLSRPIHKLCLLPIEDNLDETEQQILKINEQLIESNRSFRGEDV